MPNIAGEVNKNFTYGQFFEILRKVGTVGISGAALALCQESFFPIVKFMLQGLVTRRSIDIESCATDIGRAEFVARPTPTMVQPSVEISGVTPRSGVSATGHSSEAGAFSMAILTL